MENKKIELIYELILNGTQLNNHTLNEIGLNDSEIQNLLNQSILKTLSDNDYTLGNIQGLYDYGVNFIITHNFKKAKLCFEKCYQIDNQNRDVCLQLLFKNLRIGDYQTTLNFYEIIEKIEPEKYQSDNNLYLYLLNILKRFPPKYKQQLEQIDYDSVLLQDNNIELVRQENVIRQLIMKNKYVYALSLLNNMMAQNKTYSIQRQLLKELILQVIRSEEKFKSKILEFVQTKQYSSIILFLRTRIKKRYLNDDEMYMLLITKAIITILETNRIPTPTIYNTTYIYDAIKGNNFELALKLEEEFMKKTNKTFENSTVYLLLVQINELIENIKSNKEILEVEKNKTFTLR